MSTFAEYTKKKKKKDVDASELAKKHSSFRDYTEEVLGVELAPLRSPVKTTVDIAPVKTTTSVASVKPADKITSLMSVYGNKDFTSKSGYVSTKSEGIWEKLGSKYGMNYNDLQYEYINNQNDIRKEIDSKAVSWGSDTGKTSSSYKEKALDYMTDEEVAVYNYYYQTEGKDKAQEFLDALAETLNARKAGKDFESIEGKTAREILYGTVAGAEQFKQGVKGFGSMITGKDDYIPQTATQILTGKIREDLADDGFKVLGSSVGQIGYDALTTGTNMLPSIATGNPIAGAILLGTSASGNAYQQDLNEFGDKEQAKIYATTIGALEGTLQYMLGGIGKLGGTSAAISNAVSGVKNGALRFALEYGGKIGSEALEEGLQEVLNPLVKNKVHGTEEEVDWENVAYSALLGGLMGGVFGATEVSSTHLNANENAVVDKVYKDAIAEKEADGKKLSQKEKAKIYDETLTKLEKGYIDIDTIESVIGGDTYNSYKAEVDKEAMQEADYKRQLEALKDQANTLGNAQKYQEIEAKLNELKNNSKTTEIKKQLSEEVSKIVQGTKLSESYNERARRGQNLEVDVESYKNESAKQTAQNFADFRDSNGNGVNNTNATHDYLDLVTKVAEDRGHTFKFMTTKQLEESIANGNPYNITEDAGKVEAFVSGSTKEIVINMDANKSLTSLVGHEITHTMEGDKTSYGSLQKALFDLAKTRGEYDARWESIQRRYGKLTEEQQMQELTSDLVGDYIFGDTDFISNLSTENPNIFKKIYNEIKYLWKMATAGSKEARELERVKREFEKIWRESSQDVNSELTVENNREMVYNDNRYSLFDQVVRKHYDTKQTGFWVNDYDTYYKVTVNEDLSYDVSETININGNEDYIKELIKETKNADTNRKNISSSIAKTESVAGINDWDNASTQGEQSWSEFISEVLAKFESEGIDGNNTGIQGRGNSQDSLISKTSSKDGVFFDAENVKYSIADSKGRKLSNKTQEYFVDSKIRDENNNLKVMYHGSPAQFTVFDKKKAKSSGYYGRGFYFSESESHAGQYGSKYEVYLNIKNPVQENTKSITKEQLRRFVNELAENEDYGIENYGYDATVDSVTDDVYGKDDFAMLMDLNASCVGDMAAAIQLFNEVNGTDYDGIVAPTETVAFYPNQIKSVDNTAPTSDADIRYSLSEEVENVSDRLSMSEWKQVKTAVADYTKRNYHYEKSATGDIIIPINNKLVYTDANFDSPGIRKVIEFDSEYEDEIDAARRLIYEAEKSESGISDAYEIIEDIIGYEIIHEYMQKNSSNDKRYDRRTGRGKSQSDSYHANFLQERIRRANEIISSVNQENNVEPSSEDDGFFDGKTRIADDYYTSKEYGNHIYAKDVALAPTEESLMNSGKSLTMGEKSLPIRSDYAPLTEDEANVRDDRQIDDHYFLDDMPAETEEEYNGSYADHMKPSDPFYEKDIWEVGRNRKQKAYMYENPEVKPFFQQEARYMLGELDNSQKGEKFYNDQLYYDTNGEMGFFGTKRFTSEDIAYLLDTFNYTYKDIAKGLNAIIEDNGKENNAISKRIEFLLDERLRTGYTDFWFGDKIPPNQDYINLLNSKEITQYNDESWNNWLRGLSDDDIKYLSNTREDIAPPQEYAEAEPEYLAIRPEQPKGEPRMARVKPSEMDAAPVKEDAPVAQILTEEPTPEKKKSRFWEQAAELVADKGFVFENLSKKTNNRELEAKWNFIRYADSKAQDFIGNGADGVKSLDSIQKEVNQAGITKELYEYLYHLHNIDRMSLSEKYDDTENKPVFGDSVTADVSRSAVAELEARHPELKRYANEIYSVNNYLRNLLVEGGVISQETSDLWSEMYPHYVPIRRAGEHGLDINVPLDTGRTGVNAPLKRATGGSSDILPLFDTMAQRALQTYKAVAKNRFGVELKNTLGTTIGTEAANVDSVIDGVDQNEELLQKGKNGRRPTFTVFEGGEKVTFEITDTMYDALKPTSEALTYTNKIANTISNAHRGVLTEYNPSFLARNFIKDTQDVLINSQHPAKTYANFPKAMKEMTTKGKWYTEYVKNGGEQNTYFDKKTNTYSKEEKSKFIKAVGMPLNAISTANNFIEKLPRLAEYIASREAGRSIEVSMLDSARVTTNFAAGGDLTKFLNRNGATFLNASVQGVMQQVRNVREAKMNGLKGWAHLAGKCAVASIPAIILNNLMWDDDDEYEELSDYVKQNYYVVAKFGDGKFVRIPKGRTLAVIQDALEQTMNALSGNDEADLASFTQLVITNLAPNNPIEDNILAPVIQAWNNETWYGDDLVPTRLQDLPSEEQYDESTDSLSVWLGERVPISPYKINYLLNQYSGAVGDSLLPMITPEAESEKDTAIGKITAPIRDAFTTDSVLKNQNVSDFYDKKDELVTNAKRRGATDEDILSNKYFNSINTEIGKLYGEKREIQSGDYTDSEKYYLVKEIQKKINALSKEALNEYDNVTIDGSYATVGGKHYRLTDEGWEKLSEEEIEKQNDVIRGTGITPNDYWSFKNGVKDMKLDEKIDYVSKLNLTTTQKNALINGETDRKEPIDLTGYENYDSYDEFKLATESPKKYSASRVIGYDDYTRYMDEINDIEGEKDSNGKTKSGTQKRNRRNYIFSLDLDYGQRIILYRSLFDSNADKAAYNADIVEYLNSRDDITYEEMVTILESLDMKVLSDGTVAW